MEHLLNVYVSRAAKGSCADFLGYCEVADREATSRLTAGLWLVSRPLDISRGGTHNAATAPKLAATSVSPQCKRLPQHEPRHTAATQALRTLAWTHHSSQAPARHHTRLDHIDAMCARLCHCSCGAMRATARCPITSSAATPSTPWLRIWRWSQSRWCRQ
jgi:hypothetical protein